MAGTALPRWMILLAAASVAVPLPSPAASPGPVEGMDFVEIPGGPFRYNDADRLIATFEMMTTEVTQGQWQEVMGGNVAEYLEEAGVTGIGPDYPMTCISVYACKAFIDSLNARDPAHIYRIPDEDEWTYAYRAGTGMAFFWGDDSVEAIGSYAWFDSTSGGALHPVAQLEPNPWGLYDIAGNVMEWCCELNGNVRVVTIEWSGLPQWQTWLFGGAWSYPSRYCRYYGSALAYLDYEGAETGLRLVREPAPVPYDYRTEHRWAVFVEPALSIGGISHTFSEDDIEQFGYDVGSSCEQDGAYLRLGVGKHFGRFAAFGYGEAGYIGPGSLFDNHGPWILPEVLLRMHEFSGGVELRYLIARARFSYGTYLGEADVDLDTVGPMPSGSWTTDILDGTGYQIAAGVCVPVPGKENWAIGLEWSQHFIDLRLGRSSTGAEPLMHEVNQYEVRFFADYRLPFEI